MSSLAAYRPDRNWQVHLLAELIEAWAFNQWWRFEKALDERLDRLSGRLSPAARYLPAEVSEAGQRLLALPHAADQLLGWRGEIDGPGLAGLTEREAEAIRLKAQRLWDEEHGGWRQRTTLEIAYAMRPTRTRGLPPTVESVEQWLHRARVKLRNLFLTPALDVAVRA